MARPEPPRPAGSLGDGAPWGREHRHLGEGSPPGGCAPLGPALPGRAGPSGPSRLAARAVRS